MPRPLSSLSRAALDQRLALRMKECMVRAYRASSAGDHARARRHVLESSGWGELAELLQKQTVVFHKSPDGRIACLPS